MVSAARQPKCACGRPLHYKSQATQQQVERICEQLGDYTKVIVVDKMYLVQRHYIALHGHRTVYDNGRAEITLVRET